MLYGIPKIDIYEAPDSLIKVLSNEDDEGEYNGLCVACDDTWGDNLLCAFCGIKPPPGLK